MKKIKVSEVLLVSRILNPAKYTELEKDDKVKLLRIILTMKDAADKFEADTKVVVDKLKESDYKDYDEHLAKAQEYENLLRTNGDMSKSPIGAAEYKQFIEKEFQPLNKIIDDTMKPHAEKEVEFEPLSESAFEKFMASNDWTIGQVVSLRSYLVEDKKKEDAPAEDKTKKSKKK
jgi:hypothetical protein